ncbi:MAG: hypothetical protein F6J97_26650, partial [Leptolyngbya sp. SIO4C1]|nr:hypothetical protein [Leptolyngbya sp. SIO4C1]
MPSVCERSPVSYSLRVKDMPKDERPRERLLAFGAKTLQTAELIAILLGTGISRGNKLSAVNLGQHLLNQLSQTGQPALAVLREI